MHHGLQDLAEHCPDWHPVGARAVQGQLSLQGWHTLRQQPLCDRLVLHRCYPTCTHSDYPGALPKAHMTGARPVLTSLHIGTHGPHDRVLPDGSCALSNASCLDILPEHLYRRVVYLQV